MSDFGIKDGVDVRVTSPSLKGCLGIKVDERYGDCYVIEFTDSKGLFKLPCTQSIHRRHVRVAPEGA